MAVWGIILGRTVLNVLDGSDSVNTYSIKGKSNPWILFEVINDKWGMK